MVHGKPSLHRTIVYKEYTIVPHSTKKKEFQIKNLCGQKNACKTAFQYRLFVLIRDQ